MFAKEQASNVRREWSAFLDKVLHEKPSMIKRNRDHKVLLQKDLKAVKTLLDG